ncbi:MAG: DNA-3-methyladenine glycosylase I [Bifidobacteriaceae bacterium]|jgi:DNA-3-methyladenine glycosylase I|nr:DNA-3-methyladenine glycosylase I [Bifidobacteriaceae bacterium]
MNTEPLRCPWSLTDPLSMRYHDTEWGVPCHDDLHMFKMLVLEGKQAGLSWRGILRKMDTLCVAFDDFNPHKLITYDDAKVAELLKNPGIIRNRLKVNAAITNAKTYFALCDEFGSLDNYIWQFTDGKQVVNNWETQDQLPATSLLSDKVSTDMKKRGFKFIGSTIIYSYLQAVGVINDHLVWCGFRNA